MAGWQVLSCWGEGQALTPPPRLGEGLGPPGTDPHPPFFQAVMPVYGIYQLTHQLRVQSWSSCNYSRK